MALWRKCKNIAGLLTNICILVKNRGVYNVGIHSCSATLCGTVKHNEEAGGMSTKLQSQKILQGDVEIERLCR